MPYFCVVERTGAFTLFADYEIDDLTVRADNGETWYLHDMVMDISAVRLGMARK